MAAGPQDRIARLIRDVEKAAKQLRREFRKRAKAAPKNLQAVADRLRKGGLDVFAQVEKYVHELRVSLAGKPAPKPRTAKRATAPKRKPAPKRKATTKPRRQRGA